MANVATAFKRILTAVKHAWGHHVTTVFPRQGHYVLDEKALSKFPVPTAPLTASAISRQSIFRASRKVAPCAPTPQIRFPSKHSRRGWLMVEVGKTGGVRNWLSQSADLG